jgi:hypothetical protein
MPRKPLAVSQELLKDTAHGRPDTIILSGGNESRGF